MKHIPAWEDDNGNRFMVLAPNHVFDSTEAAREFQVPDFLWYVPYGWRPSGVLAMDLADGKGSIPHVQCSGPHRSTLAVVAGPIFDAAARDQVR